MRTQQQLSAADQAALDEMRDGDAAAEGETTPVADGQQAVTPEPEQQSDDQAAPEERRRTMVPHAALHEEREERKKLERALADERAARTLLDQRTNLLLQRMQQQAQPQAPTEPEIPALEADPVGHIVGKQNAIERHVLASAHQQQQQQELINQHVQGLALQQQIVQRAQGLEQEFQAETPDYPEAVKFLMQARHKELALIGMEQGQRAATVQQEGLALAVHALRNNQNPAQVIYDLAKMRGYAAQASAQQQPAQPQRLDNIAEGQRQSRSLSPMRGSPPAALTAQRLLEMSPKEFEKMIGTAEGKALLGS